MQVDSLRQHQLIILGNGFDLYSGLKSRFADFFQPRMDIICDAETKSDSQLQGNWGEFLNNQGITIWDLLLYEHRNQDWFDLEKTIHNCITSNKINNSGITDRYLSQAQTILGTVWNYTKHHDRYPILNQTVPSLEDSTIAAAKFILDVYPDLNSDIADRANLYGLFLLELEQLEDAFSSYLTDAVDNTPSYEANAIATFRDIKSSDMLNLHLVSTSVLSFNYTQPLAETAEQEQVNWTNIHGQLKGSDHVIFGIAGEGLLDTQEVIPFTKTYKLLKLRNTKPNSIIHLPNSDAFPQTKVIKFFGHSLGESDYSYFQAIFDGINLYENHTRLIFYYSEPQKTANDPETKEERKIQAETNTYRAVTRLLSAYGHTMTSEPAHGRNLMHKLLLEGRLEVKHIDEIRSK
ncbi:AbiH family protein [Bifidobacterium psychraerophilum]|uniref:AbiH family protein n=1 Tax=Bifidobacterium psychraerophilum TaxID=218140 RepID=UPI0039EC873C